MKTRRSIAKPCSLYTVEALEQRQLLSVSVGNIAFDDSVAPQKITVAFSGAINSSTLSASDLFLQAVTGSEPNPLATSVSYNSTSHVATFTITNANGGILNDGNYRASLVGEDVKDTSGDDVTGSGYRDFFYLTADVNNSREVDESDLYIIESNLDSSNNRYGGDVDYSGYVDYIDYETAAHQYYSSMPAPPIIGTITAGNQTTSSMELNWTDSVNGEVGYRVQRSADGANFDWYINLAADSHTYTDPALMDGKRYWWRVRAYGNGQDTAYTPKQGGTTLLTAPSDFHVESIGEDRVTLAWVTQSVHHTGFRIERALGDADFDWSTDAVPSSATSWELTGLRTNARYRFRITALGISLNSNPTLAVEATTTAAVPVLTDIDDATGRGTTAPQLRLYYSLYTNGYSTGQVQLAFETSQDGADFVEVQRLTPTLGIDNSVTVPMNEVTSYAFRLRAFFNGDASDYSNIQSYNVPPAKLTNLHMTDKQATSISIAWTDVSTNESGYEISVLDHDHGDEEVFDELLDAGTTSFTINDLEEATSYRIRVRAVAETGTSDYVEPLADTTTLFPGPSDPAADAPNPTEVNLSWTDNSATETGFRIDWWETDVPTQVRRTHAPPNATGIPFTGLDPETSYTFRVFAEKSVPGGTRTSPFPASTTSTTTPASEDPDPQRPPAPPPSPTPSPDPTDPANEPPVGAIVYRWFIAGSPQGATEFINTGQLDLPGTYGFWSETPMSVGQALMAVRGTVHSDSHGLNPADLMDYSYPGGAYYTKINSATSAEIHLEDETDRLHSDHDYNDGNWTLWMESAVWSEEDSQPEPGPPVPPPPPPPPSDPEDDGWSDVPWVSIGPDDPDGSEDPDEGGNDPKPIKFTLYRSGDTDESLTVNLFDPAGTATPGEDYSATLVSIPAGEDHADFIVTPVNDDEPEDVESVIAILKADAAYRLGAFMAEATIADNDDLTAAVNAMKISHNVASGELPKAEGDNPGAFMPVNSDDDDYDPKNLADRNQIAPAHPTLVDGEDDVLPVVLKKATDAPSKYRLILPTELKAFNSETKAQITGRRDVDATKDTTILIEAAKAGTYTFKLDWVSGDPNPTTKHNVANVKITAFDWTGPLNVPQYGTYQYTVQWSGGRPAQAGWESAANGTIVLGRAPDDVDVKWGAGPVVGNAVYQANANYVWDLEVNVVEVKVEMPADAFVRHDATDGAVDTDNIVGQVKHIYSSAANNNALDWKAKVTLNGPVDGTRGVSKMKVGFAQEAEIAKLNAIYDGIRNARVHGMQGGTYTDGDEVNSTKPWYQTTDAAVFFTPVPGGAGWNEKVIGASDKPSASFPTLADKQHSGLNELDTIELDFRFHLSVIAETIDTRNKASNSYIKESRAEWSWTTSQDLGASPNFVWNPANIIPPTQWALAADGAKALITQKWANELGKDSSQWNVHR